jgi:hypothetical protein
MACSISANFVSLIALIFPPIRRLSIVLIWLTSAFESFVKLPAFLSKKLQTNKVFAVGEVIGKIERALTN